MTESASGVPWIRKVSVVQMYVSVVTKTLMVCTAVLFLVRISMIMLLISVKNVV